MINIQRIIFYINKVCKVLICYIDTYYYIQKTRLIFYINGIKCTKVRTLGAPFVSISRNGKCYIGTNLYMNSGPRFNPIGGNVLCYIIVAGAGNLQIGNNVSMSNCAIHCSKSIIIEDNVLLGGGVCIYDTDFHSINPGFRKDILLDVINTKKAEIKIEKNVFVGAHSIILKGVTIGENSIIGAGAVVTKNIPSNQIWAGNPIRFIKIIEGTIAEE